MNRRVSSSPSHLFLAGFAGSGKTTIGRILARKLRRRLVDLDNLVETTAKQSIARLIETRGQPAFRRFESQALAGLCNTLRSPTVISLGGGTLLALKNRRVVAQHGISIYLKCSRQELVRRLGKSYGRPLLKPNSRFADLDSRVKVQLLKRRSGYQECTHSVVVTNLTPDEVAQRICGFIR